MEETFYDKHIKRYSKTESVDEEGWGTTKKTSELPSFYGNIRFDNLAELRESYGIEEEISIVITTSESIELGEILEYEGIEYRVINSIPYDTHNLIFARK